MLCEIHDAEFVQPTYACVNSFWTSLQHYSVSYRCSTRRFSGQNQQLPLLLKCTRIGTLLRGRRGGSWNSESVLWPLQCAAEKPPTQPLQFRPRSFSLARSDAPVPLLSDGVPPFWSSEWATIQPTNQPTDRPTMSFFRLGPLTSSSSGQGPPVRA